MRTPERDSINVQGLPAMVALPNGRWRREWRLTFAEELPAGLGVISAEISQEVREYLAGLFAHKYPEATYEVGADDFTLRLERVGPRSAVALTESGRYSRTDELWLIVPAYLLVCVEQAIGGLASVEGWEKEEYWLWRRRDMLLGDGV